ncbi:hypothetical protein BT67DRAFT_442179 [Trichocladium antarcticum]|uniref:Cysteine-rich transmembrane domain-containing protein n=1 Tax=Trichocladium antarcticum TaxID=1450529 RepID=A0AAN6UJQ5_9PEZI|nr:hypothetical protein BT67DRAFT_442179 [Trichocladium antarcticum]
MFCVELTSFLSLVLIFPLFSPKKQGSGCPESGSSPDPLSNSQARVLYPRPVSLSHPSPRKTPRPPTHLQPRASRDCAHPDASSPPTPNPRPPNPQKHPARIARHNTHTKSMSHKPDDPPAYGAHPPPNPPQPSYGGSGGPPPAPQPNYSSYPDGSASAYYQAGPPMGYHGQAHPHPPPMPMPMPMQPQPQPGYYSGAPGGPYGPPPPGQGYPPQQGGMYYPPQERQKSGRPGIFEACLAGMACCCCLDILF